MSVADLSPAHRRFRYEADMLAPLAVGAKQLIGRHSNIVFEVPAAAGIPDLVVASLDYPALLERVDRVDGDFLTNPTELAVVLHLSGLLGRHAGGATSAQLANAVGITRRHLSSTMLPNLLERRHVRSDGELWYVDAPYRSLVTRLLTIEAKLHDWKKGLAQAARQVPGSDEAWLILDHARHDAAARRLDLFELYQVALATVDYDGELRVLQRPTGTTARPLSARRELLAERVASLIARGSVSGPVPAVFGTVLAASTGFDPRLQGAGAG